MFIFHMLKIILQESGSLHNEGEDDMFDWVDDYKATGVMYSKKNATEFKAQLAHVDHKSEVCYPTVSKYHSRSVMRSVIISCPLITITLTRVLLRPYTYRFKQISD